ncbi:MAG: DNA-directed RNA polymerase subunit beta', partial [Chloroflexi bacterium]|nr:DNA-directed RNA polymerase subunit beta' [Chloroflexota bacterium]
EILAENAGRVQVKDNKIVIHWDSTQEEEYQIESAARVRVSNGDRVVVGQQLTEGSLNPNRILRVLGREAAQLYLLEEVQKVYRSQGVPINDKHIEVIVRQMTNKVRIVTSGDSDYLPGELLDYQKFQNMNQDLMAQSKRSASGRPILLGITKAALNTDSFLSASSFQHTINVLAQAAIEGKRDELFGLKENVILGKLIPAGTGYQHYHTVADENGDITEEIQQLVSADESIDLATGGNGASEISSATDELSLSA